MDLKKMTLLAGLVLSVAGGGLTGCESMGGSTNDGRSEGRAMDDKKITEKVQAGLKSEPVYKMHGVEVNTFRGVVQLSGFVDTAAQKQRAEQVARNVPGIHDVLNQIAIKPEPVMPTGRQQQHQQQYSEPNPNPATTNRTDQ